LCLEQCVVPPFNTAIKGEEKKEQKRKGKKRKKRQAEKGRKCRKKTWGVVSSSKCCVFECGGVVWCHVVQMEADCEQKNDKSKQQRRELLKLVFVTLSLD